MAEFMGEKVLGNEVTRVVNENSTNLECAVCLQTCIHPAELPCGHIFCYLCIKGIVNQGRRCAMCRQDIPVDFLENPKLLKPVEIDTKIQGFEDGHLWFYEGHNGWWQYDERTNVELESAYQKGERSCELLIAGFLYIADFDAMLQYRRSDPWKRRRIKRDLATTSKKGVAGLKPKKESGGTSSSVPDLSSRDLMQGLTTSSRRRSSLAGLRLSSLSESGPSDHGQTNTDRLRQRNRNLTGSFSWTTSNTSSQNRDNPLENFDLFSDRNVDLDSIIHDTLDWTIEQIESLNLELVNDYEVLFRDVSNYNSLVERYRSRSTSNGNNYLSRYLNTRRSLDNELDSNMEGLIRPNPAGNADPNEDSTTDGFQSQGIPIQGGDLPPPLPPRRTRGESHLISRDTQPTQPTQPIQPTQPTQPTQPSQPTQPRRSTSLSRETLF